MVDTIEVFISYSKQDKELRDRLLVHLRPLEREGIITWHDRQIPPGSEWDEEIKTHLNTADIILLLVSSDFLATNYCTQVEIPEALRRHEANEAIVMPVILRACGWQYTLLAKIQAYPEKAKPVVSWAYIDEAYTDVVNGVYLAASEIKKRHRQTQAEQESIQRDQSQTEEWEKTVPRQAIEATVKDRGRKPKQQQSFDALKGNYIQLEAFLKAGKWKEADYETAKQMSDVMGYQKLHVLGIEDIKQFPCADLRTVDQLWAKYSKGKFGFSVQKQIWQKWGSPTKYESTQWGKFGEEIGWKKKGFLGINNHWKIFSEVTFDISAPPGHLPVLWNSTMEFGKWKEDFHNALAYGWITNSWEHVIIRSPSHLSSLTSRLETCTETEKLKSQKLENQ